MNMENGGNGNKKFTCYFCNKTIEHETEMGHNAMCGSVLESCPNKCGSYVPRMAIRKHRRECVNRIVTFNPRVPTIDENVNRIPNNTANSPATSTKSSSQKTDALHNFRLQEELKMISKKISNLEANNSYLQTILQKRTSNSSEYCGDIDKKMRQHNSEIEELKYQSKLSFDWRRQTEDVLNNLKYSFQNEIQETNSMLVEFRNKTRILDKMQKQIDEIRNSFLEDQTHSRQMKSTILDDFRILKSDIAEDNAKTISILMDLRNATENLKKEIDKESITIQDHKTKFTNIIFDLKAASQIASEATERVEIIEREFAGMQKEFHQMKLDMEILEGLSSSKESESVPGRLIWKITEIENKIMKAREFGSILKSPVFSTHEFGYKIRVLLYLNGLKKWKDRYVLICIHVLKGEYDMLLRWPCHIESTIKIRKLQQTDEAKPLSKYVSAKRQIGDEENDEPQESSTSYMFIPHSILLRPEYVHNDMLFLEVEIHKNGKLETSF